jgi:hypothetical protein
MGRSPGKTVPVLQSVSDSVLVTFCLSLWISLPASQHHPINNPEQVRSRPQSSSSSSFSSSAVSEMVRTSEPFSYWFPHSTLFFPCTSTPGREPRTTTTIGKHFLMDKVINFVTFMECKIAVLLVRCT